MNPFSNWTQADVAAHNERVSKKDRENVYSGNEPPVAQSPLCNGPAFEAPLQKIDTSGLYSALEEVWRILDGNTDFFSSNKEEGKRKFLITLIDHRLRTTDSDNLTGKYIQDCLAYAGKISSDDSQTTRCAVGQRRVATAAEVGLYVEVIEF